MPFEKLVFQTSPLRNVLLHPLNELLLGNRNAVADFQRREIILVEQLITGGGEIIAFGESDRFPL